MRSYNWL